MTDAPSRPRGFGPRPSDQIARAATDRLSALWRTAGRLEQLTTCVRACLPELLRPHVSVVRQDGDDLVLVASNASWATRLRLLADELRDDLAELPEFRRVRRIRVQIGTG